MFVAPLPRAAGTQEGTVPPLNNVEGDGHVRGLWGKFLKLLRLRNERRQLRFLLADASSPDRLTLAEHDGERAAKIREGTVVDDSLVVLLNHLTDPDG